MQKKTMFNVFVYFCYFLYLHLFPCKTNAFSRLRTGWCAARSEPPLSASEREAIAAVVKRAEKLDEVEAKRVGRLVARLEGIIPTDYSTVQSNDSGKSLRILAKNDPLTRYASFSQRSSAKVLSPLW